MALTAVDLSQPGKEIAAPTLDHEVILGKPTNSVGQRAGVTTLQVIKDLIGGGSVTVSAAAPTAPAPSEGDQWWDTTGTPDAALKVRIGSAWVSAADPRVATWARAVSPSGVVPTVRLGSGTANSTRFLRGDGTWATPPTGGGGAAITVSATAPASPSEGDQWWDTTGTPDTGLKVRVGSAWVPAADYDDSVLRTALDNLTAEVTHLGPRTEIAGVRGGSGTTVRYTLPASLANTRQRISLTLHMETPSIQPGASQKFRVTLDSAVGGIADFVRDIDHYRGEAVFIWAGDFDLTSGGFITFTASMNVNPQWVVEFEAPVGPLAHSTVVVGGGGGLSQSEVDARILSWARVGNATLVPSLKLAPGIGNSAGFLRGDRTWSDTLTTGMVISPLANSIGLLVKGANVSNNPLISLQLYAAGTQEAISIRRGETGSPVIVLDGNLGGNNNKPGIAFGPGGNVPRDTNLYRENVSHLKTNAIFTAASYRFGAGGAALTRASLGLGSAAVKNVGTTVGLIALLSTLGRFPTARLGGGTPTTAKFLRGDQSWEVPPIRVLSTALPKDPGLAAPGTSSEVSRRDHVHDLPPAAGTGHGVKRVSKLPATFDEAVLYLTHTYQRGVALDLTVTPGEEVGRYGWSDGSLFGAFGSLGAADDPGAVEAIFGDPAGRAINYILLNNSDLARKVDRVEVNGTLYAVGEIDYLYGHPVLELASPPTGLPTLASGNTFTVNLRLTGGDFVFNTGSLESVSAGLYAWSGGAYEKLIPGAGGRVDLPFSGYRTALPEVRDQTITTTAGGTLRYRTSDVDFATNGVAVETSPTVGAVIVAQTLKFVKPGFFNIGVNLQFRQDTNQTRVNLRSFLILSASDGVERQRVEVTHYSRGLTSPGSIYSSANGTVLWSVQENDVLTLVTQTETGSYSGRYGGTASALWAYRVPAQVTAEAGASGQGDGATQIATHHYRLTFFARAALQPADPLYRPTTTGLSPAPTDTSVWQSADPDPSSILALWLTTMEYVYNDESGEFTVGAWTTARFGGFRVRYANHWPESESGWHEPPQSINDRWMQIRLSNGSWSSSLRIATDPFGDVSWRPLLDRTIAYSTAADQVLTFPLLPQPSIYGIQEVLFRATMFSGWGSDGATPTIVGRAEAVWSTLSGEALLPRAAFGSMAAKDEHAWRLQVTRQHGIVGLALGSAVEPDNDYPAIQATLWVRLVASQINPNYGLDSIQVFGHGSTYNRIFLEVATRGR